RNLRRWPPCHSISAQTSKKPTREIVERERSRGEPLLGFARADQIVIVAIFLGALLQRLLLDVNAFFLGMLLGGRECERFLDGIVERAARGGVGNGVIDRIRAPAAEEDDGRAEQSFRSHERQLPAFRGRYHLKAETLALGC